MKVADDPFRGREMNSKVVLPRIFHTSPENRLLGIESGCRNGYRVNGRQRKFLDWIISQGSVEFQCGRCGQTREVLEGLLVDHWRNRLPNEAFDEILTKRFDRIVALGYDFSCQSCCRAIRLCYSPFESPPWSSQYRVAIFLVLECQPRR